MESEKQKSSVKRAGSRILLQVTALLVVVFIVTGIVAFLFFRNSQSHLIQKSEDKLVEYRAGLISSMNLYTTNLMTQLQLLSIPGSTTQSIQNDLDAGIGAKKITPLQKVVNDTLKMMVDNGLFNDKLAFFSLPPGSEAAPEPLIVMSSDDSNIYKEVPAELMDLAKMGDGENTADRARIDAHSSYMLAQDGIPELNLEGEYLVNAYKFKPETEQGSLWYYSFTPMHDELAAINDFYRNEKGKINLVLALVLAGSTVALFLITFFMLSFMIRKKITRPIEELSDAAEKVMEGDVDVIVPVRKGEEFEGLKNAFNEMLSSLRKVIHRATQGAPGLVDETPAGDIPDAKDSRPARRKGMSSMLIRITALVVVIFIISGGISLLFFQRSQTRLIEKSKDKVVQSEVEITCSVHLFMYNLLMKVIALTTPDIASAKAVNNLINSLKYKTLDAHETAGNDLLKGMTDSHLLGITLAMETMPPLPGVSDETLVAQCSDSKLVFKEVPKILVDLQSVPIDKSTPYKGRLDEDNIYMLVENGIPEFGLKGEHLVAGYVQEVVSGIEFWFYDFKPMHKKLAAIDDFYNRENRNTLIVMCVVIGISIIAVFTVIFVFLSYLIRNRITRPIEELSAAAELVMEGDLNAEVPVRKGEEFERLKRAFNEMLKSIRELMEKA